MFGYMVFIDVQVNDEEVEALVESGMIKATINLRRGELLTAFEVDNRDQLAALLVLMRDATRLGPALILISESETSLLYRRWNESDLVICISLLMSEDVDRQAIANRVQSSNPNAEVELVSVRSSDGEQAPGVLAQLTGARKGDVLRQLADALAASGASSQFTSFSESDFEREQRTRRERLFFTPPDDTGAGETDEQVQRIATRRGIDRHEAAKAAAQTLDWIDMQIDSGGRFILIKDHTRRRVSFPR